MSEQQNPPRRVLGETYYTQVSENIRNVFELTTRIDERVQIMMKKQEDLEKKIDAPTAAVNALLQRVAVLESKTTEAISLQLDKHSDALRVIESRLQNVEGDTTRSGERGKQIMGFAVQLLWVVVAAYILYKLHLQAPP